MIGPRLKMLPRESESRIDLLREHIVSSIYWLLINAMLTAILGMKYGRKGRKPKQGQIPTSRDHITTTAPSEVELFGTTISSEAFDEDGLFEEIVQGTRLDQSNFNFLGSYAPPSPVRSQTLFQQDQWLTPKDWDIINSQ